MHFMRQTLKFIIFVFLISNIVTSSKNSSVMIDKHVKIDTKKNIYNTTSDNNINDGSLTTEKPDDDDNLRHNMDQRNLAIILIFIICPLILLYMCLYPWRTPRCECNIQYIRANCLRFREWCVRYIRNFPNTDLPEVPSHIDRQPEPADYQDMYEMSNLPVEPNVRALPNTRASI